MVISNKYRNFALAFEKESNDGAIAQLVEQRTENPCVPGSIPGGTTQKRLRDIEVFFVLYASRIRVLRCISLLP